MKKIISILILCFAILGGSATFSHAAGITFDAGGTRVGTQSTFSVDVFLSAPLPVNAITVVIPLPPTVEFVGSSDANSIVSLWVEKPKLNDKHEVILSGLIPGGFGAEGGKIITLYLSSAKAGQVSFATAPGSVAYLHSETGQSDTVTSRPLTLTLVDGLENKPVEVADTVPPESFVPVYIQIGEEDSLRWAVGFGAQDKGSGVKEYYVAESRKKIAVDGAGNDKLAQLSWKLSDSPAVLEDQSLKSYVYVKAADRNGNERVARLAPAAKWYQQPIGYILIAVLLIGVLYAIFFRKNKLQRRFY